MKSLNSFTDLPISKGLLLIVEDKNKKELEKHMLDYIEAEDSTHLEILPMMRFLNEKMDLKGDDLKITFCAVCQSNPERYHIKGKLEYCFKGNALEKRILPYFDDEFRTTLIYKSDEELAQEKKEMEDMYNNIEIYEIHERESSVQKFK